MIQVPVSGRHRTITMRLETVDRPTLVMVGFARDFVKEAEDEAL
jgi:hypothetical protein